MQGQYDHGFNEAAVVVLKSAGKIEIVSKLYRLAVVHTF